MDFFKRVSFLPLVISILVIANLVLFGIYFYNKNRPITLPESITSNTSPFKSSDPIYRNSVNTTMIQGDLKGLLATTLSLSGTVNKGPYIDSEGIYFFDFYVENTKGEKYYAKVLLGHLKSSVRTHGAKGGIISDPVFSLKTPVELSQILRPATHVLIYIPFQKIDKETIENLPNCNDYCKKVFRDANNYYDQNLFFINGLNKSSPDNSKLSIGPITGLIYYEQN